MVFYVYIATNKPRGVLYTGMTDDINNRMRAHREHLVKGSFTDKYNCEKLAWFETHETRQSAFIRERQIKKWKRDWKINLIETMNPDWTDLAAKFLL